MNTTEQAAYSAAKAAHRAGLCVLPPGQNGSKRPDDVIGKWGAYQKSRSTEKDIETWYRHGRTGVGAVMGTVSGNVELFEFDDRPTYDDFLQYHVEAGLGVIISRIRDGYEEDTPSGGVHWLYRCATISGNEELACRPRRDEEQRKPGDTTKVLIETRGQGGYAVLAPSNGKVHPTGGSYQLRHGGFASIATITPEERVALWQYARSFDRMPTPEPRSTPTRAVQSGGRPGDEFAAAVTWAEILEPAGWTLVFTRGETEYWRRPGKSDSWSATTNHAGSDLLYVFTSSTILEQRRGYGKFSAYAKLHHSDDYKAAAAALAAQGYGSARQQALASEVFGEPWPERQPLPTAPATPTMPEKMLPAPLREWLVDTARQACLPLECLSIPAMVAVSALIGRAVGIKPWSFNQFVITPNLWGAIVDRPGALKSFAIDEAVKPLERLAAASRDRERAAAVEAQAQIAGTKAEIEGVKQAIAAAAKKGNDTELLKARLNDKLEEVAAFEHHERRYITSDATTEKLADMLTLNPRGMLVLRDELIGLFRSMEKKGHEQDRGFYLTGWNGTNGYAIDRVLRGSSWVEAVTISVLGGMQPARLTKFVREAINGDEGDDGMIQRMQLMVWPDAPLAWQPPDRWPNREARRQVFTIFEWLDGITAGELGAEQPDEGIPYLTFDAPAQQLADAWHNELEHRLRSDGLVATPAFASHLAKYRSLMPSLALLFALLDWAAAGGSQQLRHVGLDAIQLAAEWCDFLELHAQKVYAAELAPDRDAAHSLAAHIESHSLVSGMSPRDIQRTEWAGLTELSAIQAGLHVLEGAGWLRLNTISTGGRPAVVITLHPDFGGDTDG